MNKLEEKVNINIEVDDNPKQKKEGQSQDIIIEMNTGEGVAKFETIKLNGRFEALILTSDKPVQIEIKSELGYLIYEVKEYVKTTYIALRTQAWNEESHQLNFLSEPFYFN